MSTHRAGTLASSPAVARGSRSGGRSSPEGRAKDGAKDGSKDGASSPRVMEVQELLTDLKCSDATVTSSTRPVGMRRRSSM